MIRLRAGMLLCSAVVVLASAVSLAQAPAKRAPASATRVGRPRPLSPIKPSEGGPSRASRAQLTRNPGQQARGLPPATVMTSPTQAAVPSQRPSVPLAQIVGQQMMVRMAGTTPDASLLSRIRAGQVGGVILYSDNIVSPAQAANLVDQLQASARAGGNPPLLISTDQEGGEVKRLSWAAPTLSAQQMGAAGPSAAEAQGHQTGVELRKAGINVDLAPDADVAHSSAAFIWQQHRSFGMTAETVTSAAAAFAQGLQSAGVAGTAKHYPGLGGAARDTDYAQQTLILKAVDVEAYHTLIAQGIPLVMASVATYANLDPAHPAALSPTAISGLLRDRLHYDGVVKTDDLQAPTGQSTARAAVQADRAGDDIILVSTTEQGGADAYSALEAAARDGQIPHAHMIASYDRILRLKTRYAGTRRSLRDS